LKPGLKKDGFMPIILSVCHKRLNFPALRGGILPFKIKKLEPAHYCFSAAKANFNNK